MQSIYEGLEQLGHLIQWPYLVIFLLLSYLVENYFRCWLDRKTPFVWKKVYTVLVIATLLAIPFIIIAPDKWVEILLTYSIGTSFHETILGKVINKIKGE